jgi:3-hydroxyisobutyrate dehydrogenase
MSLIATSTASPAHTQAAAPARASIAFIGLGAMGSRMAARLLAAGHRVSAWNRSSAAVDALRSAGAHAEPTPADAARGEDIVFSMVFDDAASREVWLHPQHGALAAMRPGAIAVECSTLSPAWIDELAARAAERGVRFVDAPVAGSRPQAQAGQLIFMAGGAATDVDALRPTLAALGGAVHHVGPAGAGARLKLLVNALFGIQVTAMAELLGFARSAGLDLDASLAALRSMPVTSPAAAGAAALMLAGNDTPQAPIDLIHKDLGYALTAAGGEPALPITAQAQTVFARAQQRGWGGENLVAVRKLYA